MGWPLQATPNGAEHQINIYQLCSPKHRYPTNLIWFECQHFSLIWIDPAYHRFDILPRIIRYYLQSFWHDWRIFVWHRANVARRGYRIKIFAWQFINTNVTRLLGTGNRLTVRYRKVETIQRLGISLSHFCFMATFTYPESANPLCWPLLPFHSLYFIRSFSKKWRDKPKIPISSIWPNPRIQSGIRSMGLIMYANVIKKMIIDLTDTSR